MQMGPMVAALAEAQQEGFLPPLTLHTLVHTLCRKAALEHLATMVNDAQDLLAGQDAEEQYNTLQELRCTVAEAVQYVVQGPGLKVRLQLARRAQAAAVAAVGQAANGAAGGVAGGLASAAAGNGVPALNGGGGHVHHSHPQPQEEQQQQQQPWKQQQRQEAGKGHQGHPGRTANGSLGAALSPPVPDIEHLLEPVTPKDATRQPQQQQQEQDSISKPVYSPNYGSALDPLQQPHLLLPSGEPEALELEWDPAAAGPSDLPHLKAAAAAVKAAAASSRGASPAYQQQQQEDQQESEDWLTDLCGAGVLAEMPPGDPDGLGAAAAAPGDTGAAGAMGGVSDDEAPPPVDWTEEPVSKADGLDVGAAGQPAAAGSSRGGGSHGAQQQMQKPPRPQQQGVKRKPAVTDNLQAQPSAKRQQQQQQAQRPTGADSTPAAGTSKAAAAEGKAASKVQNGPTSSSRQQSGKQQASDPASRGQGTAAAAQSAKGSGQQQQQQQTAAGDKATSQRSQPVAKGATSSSEGVPKAAPGVTRSSSQPKATSASRGRGSSRSPPPPGRRRSRSPRSRSSRTPPRSPRRGGSPRPFRRRSPGPVRRRRSPSGSRPAGRSRSRSPRQHSRGPSRRSRSRSPVLGPRVESRARGTSGDREGQQRSSSRGPRGEEERAGAPRPPYRTSGGRRVDHYSPSPERGRKGVDSPAGTDPGAAGGVGDGVNSPFGAGSMPPMPVDVAVGGGQGWGYVPAHMQQQRQQQQQPQGAGGGWGDDMQWGAEAGVAEVLAAAMPAAAAGHSSHYRQPLAAGMPVADMSLAQLHAQESSHTKYYNQLQAQQQGGYGTYPGSRDPPQQYGPGSSWGRGQEGGPGGYGKPAWLRQPDMAGGQQQPYGSSGGAWQASPMDAPAPQPSPASQLEPSPRPRVYERLSGLAEPLSPPGQGMGQEGSQRRPSVFAGRLQKLSSEGDDHPRPFGERGSMEGHNSSKHLGPGDGAASRGGSREEQAPVEGAAAADPDGYVAQVVELLRGRPGRCIVLGALRGLLPVPQQFLNPNFGVFKFFESYPQFKVERERSLVTLVGTGRASPQPRAGRDDTDRSGWGSRGPDRPRQLDRHADRPAYMPHRQQDDRDSRYQLSSPGRGGGGGPERPSGPELHNMILDLSKAIRRRMEDRGLQQINLQREVWPLVIDKIRHLLHPDGPITLVKFAQDFLLYYDVVMLEEQLGGRWQQVPYLVHRSNMRKQMEPCAYWKPHMWGGCFKGAACKFRHSLTH